MSLSRDKGGGAGVEFKVENTRRATGSSGSILMSVVS